MPNGAHSKSWITLGCLMKSYLKEHTINELDCQYKLFEELIPVLLELNYGNK